MEYNSTRFAQRITLFFINIFFDVLIKKIDQKFIYFAIKNKTKFYVAYARAYVFRAGNLMP